MNRNHFLAGGLCLCIAGVSANPNHHTAFVSGQVEFQTEVGAMIAQTHNAHGMWFVWRSEQV